MTKNVVIYLTVHEKMNEKNHYLHSYMYANLFQTLQHLFQIFHERKIIFKNEIYYFHHNLERIQINQFVKVMLKVYTHILLC